MKYPPRMTRPQLAAIIVSGLLVACAGGIAVVGWPGLVLATAVLSAETRPTLLRDGGWGKVGSAGQFKTRFRAGSPVIALLDWLQANDFAVDLTGRQASRTIRGLPCEEYIKVNWQADSRGNLIDASAEVDEAGCL